MDVPEVADLTGQDTADGVQQQVVGAVVDHGGKVLLLRRPAGVFLGGTWEFPAGKVDPGEDLLTALHREVAEETGLTISGITGYLGSFEYAPGRGKPTRQHTWSVTVTGAEAVHLTEHDSYCWVGADDKHPLRPELKALLDKHFSGS